MQIIRLYKTFGIYIDKYVYKEYKFISNQVIS